MSLYTHQPELPHGLPTISHVQGYPTPPGTPPNELEEMVQELTDGLPLLDLDTDIVTEDETTDAMLIDEELVRELIPAARDDSALGKVNPVHYILSEYNITVETHLDGQAVFAAVASVIVREPNLHGAWRDASD